MYICKNCGEVFEEPIVTYDDPSPAGISLPAGAYEYHECPYCGSDDFEEAEKCKICGEYYLTGTDCKDYCQECHQDLSQQLSEIQNYFDIDAETFKDFILEHYE